MDLGLTGRTAVVLGASQGMGLAIAEGLVAEGAKVAMFARRADVVEREAARLGALAVPGDLTRHADLERLVDATVAEFGGDRRPRAERRRADRRAPAVDLTADSVTAAVNLLLVPHVTLVSLCLPHLRASGRGRIIAIESTSVKEPIPNLALSNAVRPGVAGWLKTLSRELGPDGITVNTIAPGRIDTERLARHLRPRRPGAGDARPDPGSPHAARPPRSPPPCASSPRSRPPTSLARSCRSTAAC